MKIACEISYTHRNPCMQISHDRACVVYLHPNASFDFFFIYNMVYPAIPSVNRIHIYYISLIYYYNKPTRMYQVRHVIIMHILYTVRYVIRIRYYNLDNNINYKISNSIRTLDKMDATG